MVAATNIWTERQEAAYQAAVIEAKAKYNEAQAGWIAFVVHLREVELSGVWRRPGDAQFADFLRREFPTAFGVERYRNVVKAVEVYGQEFMERIGPDVAHCLTTDGMLTRDDAVSEVRGWCEEHYRVHGVMPGTDEVLGYTKRFTREPRPLPRLVRQQTEVRRLRSENVELKRDHAKAAKAVAERESLAAENARLKVELKAARARIRELERELGAARKELARHERSGGAKKLGGARTSKDPAARGSRRRLSRGGR